MIVFLFSLAVCVACQHSGKEDMRLRLDYVSRCNRADTVFTEAWLPRVDSLVTYFDRHGNANERMMAHYLQGRVYHDMGEAPQALECYQTATEQADTTREDCNLHTLAAIYGQMADLYNAQYLPDDEMKSVRMAEYFDWKNKDTIAAITAYRLRTRPYFLRNDTDSMLFVTRESMEMYRQFGRKDLAAQILIMPISVCIDRGQYNEAGNYMRILEKESGFFDDKGNILCGKELYYYYKGMYALSQNLMDESIIYFRKTISAGIMEAGYKGLLTVYQKKQIPDSIAKYAELFAKANDSCYYHVNQGHIKQISAMYDYTRHQRMADLKKAELEKSRRKVLALIIVVLSLVFLFVTYYLYKKRKMEKKINSMTRDYASLNMELSRHKKEATDIERHYLSLLSEMSQKEQGLQERIQTYKKEITLWNSEYQSSIDELRETQKEIETIKESYDQTMKEKNAMIEELQVKVTEIEKPIQDIQHMNQQQSFYTSSIYKTFDSLRIFTKGYQPPSDTEWKSLISLFAASFTGYYIFISKDNILTQDQLRLCVLLRLNFTESEMALLMGRNHKQSINKIKSQINNKLFGKNEARSLRDNIKPYF